MSDRIKEEAISTTNFLKYTDVFVAAPGGAGVGEPVFRLREILPGSGRYDPPREMTVRHLMIEVDAPEEEATRDRVRTAVTAQMRKR